MNPPHHAIRYSQSGVRPLVARSGPYDFQHAVFYQKNPPNCVFREIPDLANLVYGVMSLIALIQLSTSPATIVGATLTSSIFVPHEHVGILPPSMYLAVILTITPQAGSGHTTLCNRVPCFLVTVTVLLVSISVLLLCSFHPVVGSSGLTSGNSPSVPPFRLAT